MKLGEIGEFGFIRRVAPLCIARPEGVYKGIGDDCALIELNADELLLMTTDLLIERSHFKLGWTSPEDLGSKSLAVNISDIAACGGVPREAFVSLAIPNKIKVEWLDRFYDGLTGLAKVFDINVLGGDTASSKADLMINIALTGLVQKNQALLRSSARPGDSVCLIGVLGESAAGLRILASGLRKNTPAQADLIRSHLRPTPLVKEGRLLAESGLCTALIDVSDGLSADLNHLCEQSGVGAIILEDQIPISKKLLEVFPDSKKRIMKFILHGGEDYALLAAIRTEGLTELKSRLKEIGSVMRVIGKFTDDSGHIFLNSNGKLTDLQPLGWDHFK